MRLFITTTFLLFLIPLTLIWPTTTFASVIFPWEAFIYISGEIEKGDDNIFSEVVKKSVKPAVVIIDSPGGNVGAAINIGKIIRKKGFAVSVQNDKTCASSCVMILAAGVTRIVYERAKVVIHRPYIDGELKGDGDYDANYKNMLELLNNYFHEMNVPNTLVSRMMTIPPHLSEELSEAELEEYMLSGEDPAYTQRNASTKATEMGVSVTELNKRKAVADQLCNMIFQGTDPDNLAFFDFMVSISCKEAILQGQERDIVLRRLKAAMKHREPIELLSISAQEICLNGVLLTGETKNCPINW
jgi:ATP-dependent protease ClpP protease subunit